MSGYVASLTGMEKVYLGCAIFGGGLFIVRMVLMLMGLGGGDTDVAVDADGGLAVDTDGGMDLHADVDAQGDLADAHGDLGDAHGDYADDAAHPSDSGDTDASLKFLTIQGITAFVMMFGLTGYAVSRSSVFGSALTLAFGAVAGLAGMWLVAKGFAVMNRLQSTGTMNIYDAIGEEGSVYLSIPADGIGKVQVAVSGRLMVMDASSQDQAALKTGERIVVADVVSGRVLSVRKKQEQLQQDTEV